jgi:hypothetical protein
VAEVSTPDGGGAWLVASERTVDTAGAAPNDGAPAGTPLNQPIVGISPTDDGPGYALVAADGGVFDYGDSVFYSSTGT